MGKGQPRPEIGNSKNRVGTTLFHLAHVRTRGREKRLELAHYSVWCIGRLETDAERQHFVDGLAREQCLVPHVCPTTRYEIFSARQSRTAIEGIELPRNNAVPLPMVAAMQASVRTPKLLRFAEADSDV